MNNGYVTIKHCHLGVGHLCVLVFNMIAWCDEITLNMASQIFIMQYVIKKSCIHSHFKL